MRLDLDLKWTSGLTDQQTESEASSTSLSEFNSRDSQEGNSSDRDGSEEGEREREEEDEGEGESMIVPLQPFDHAVGGHSSIYKFTRRAVCKVSLGSVLQGYVMRQGIGDNNEECADSYF